MIVEGASRAGSRDLARHILRTDTNEHVSVLEAVVPGETREEAVYNSLEHFQYVARLTNGTKGLYHANIDPRRDDAMREEDWIRAVDILEEQLGFTGQARVVVRHVKEGRAHCHVVWQRCDAEQRILISDSHNYRKHELAAVKMEREFGHAHVQNRSFAGRPRDPENSKHFSDQRPLRVSFNQAAWHKAQRSGLDPKHQRAEITNLFRHSDNGKAFRAALTSRGYQLAKGDKRPDTYFVVDRAGEMHRLHDQISARRKDGKKEYKKADIEARLKDLPPAQLPSVAAVTAQHAAWTRQTVPSREREKQMQDGSTRQAQQSGRKLQPSTLARTTLSPDDARLEQKRSARLRQYREMQDDLVRQKHQSGQKAQPSAPARAKISPDDARAEQERAARLKGIAGDIARQYRELVLNQERERKELAKTQAKRWKREERRRATRLYVASSPWGKLTGHYAKVLEANRLEIKTNRSRDETAQVNLAIEHGRKRQELEKDHAYLRAERKAIQDAARDHVYGKRAGASARQPEQAQKDGGSYDRFVSRPGQRPAWQKTRQADQNTASPTRSAGDETPREAESVSAAKAWRAAAERDRQDSWSRPAGRDRSRGRGR